MIGEWATGTRVTGCVVRGAPYPFAQDVTWKCSCNNMRFLFADLTTHSLEPPKKKA